MNEQMKIDNEINGNCRRILDILQTAILVFDEQLILRYINSTGEMLLGVSARRVMDVGLVEVLDNREIVLLLQAARDNGNMLSLRGVMLHQSYGHDITVDVMAIPTTDIRGCNDIILELTHVDRQLRINREEGLLAQNQASRELVRGLAHEIKNPLGGLRGAAQLLERELHDEELKEYTQVIINEADRLQLLIDQMLGPKKMPERRMVNIHEALERVRQVVSADCNKNITFERDYDPSIPEIYGDLDQLIQAIMNLVRNAAQAVADEDGVVRIRTRSVHQFTIGSSIHKLVAKIDVIDNGPGIDDTVRDSIFLPMITSKTEGTGLGLPIAQSLISLHNGLIEWKSRPGRTIFTILLPIRKHKEQV